jgi:hypothetical protein
MRSRDRRAGFRVPLEVMLTEFESDRPARALSVNISETGLYVNKVIANSNRASRVVGLEFELPGTGEVIWARGEVCHDDLDPFFHGQGIRFTAMPKLYARMIRDYCIERRRAVLEGLYEKVRRYG